MTRSDRVRRAVTLTLVVLCFLVVPQLASAQFSSRQTPTVSVSTVKLVTPTAVTGTYRCNSFFAQWVDVDVTGFASANQPAGVSYVYTLYRNGTQRDTVTTTAKQASLESGTQGATSSTTYKVTIFTKLDTWTSESYSKTFTCGLFGSSGSL